jgi:predicted RNase H-like nuclease (RuvC/YqgF family)
LHITNASVKSEVYASQNEIKDLRQELKNKDGEIKSLHITNASHELDVYVSHIKIKDLHQKIEMLTSNYDKAAVVLNNIIASSSVQISQLKVEVSTLAEEMDLLAMRLNEEDQGKECMVCSESRKECLFLPCRHMCVCKGCASLIKAKDCKCPLCRTVSEQVMRVFH